MGIAKGCAQLLLQESLRKPFEGRVLTLGNQDIWFSYSALEEMARENKIPLKKLPDILLSLKPDLRERGYISSRCFFEELGFSQYESMDVSGYEAVNHIFDLNESEVPEHLLERFDVIVDGGTVEHVFHVPNALKNLYKMLKKGGRIVHLSPTSNYIDHGFYMFSPTLFWDYYTANRFEINKFHLIAHTAAHDLDPWEISNYTPGSVNDVSYGGLDDRMYSLLCIVTKTAEASCGVIPQQRNYAVGFWKGGLHLASEAKRTSPLASIKAEIRKYPFLFKALRFFYKPFASKGLKLKVTGRF